MSGDTKYPKITEVRYSKVDIAYAIELPISPFGKAEFATKDNSSESAHILREIAMSWDKLWPEILEHLQDGIAYYRSANTRLGSEELMGFVARLIDGQYKSDEADTFVRLEFEAPPLWDFYIKGTLVVHSQPVF